MFKWICEYVPVDIWNKNNDNIWFAEKHLKAFASRAKTRFLAWGSEWNGDRKEKESEWKYSIYLFAEFEGCRCHFMLYLLQEVFNVVKICGCGFSLNEIYQQQWILLKVQNKTTPTTCCLVMPANKICIF